MLGNLLKDNANKNTIATVIDFTAVVASCLLAVAWSGSAAVAQLEGTGNWLPTWHSVWFTTAAMGCAVAASVAITWVISAVMRFSKWLTQTPGSVSDS